MVRKVANDFPANERPASIIDKGWQGRAKVFHITGGDLAQVNRFIGTLPADDLVWVVASGNVYVCSPPPCDDTNGILIGTEYRTVLLYTPVRQVSSPRAQAKLNEGAQQFYNPRTEKHEIDTFVIRHKSPRHDW